MEAVHRRPVPVASPSAGFMALDAAYPAGTAVGLWSGEGEVADAWRPRRVVEPRRKAVRDRWREMAARARRTVPELSALEF